MYLDLNNLIEWISTSQALWQKLWSLTKVIKKQFFLKDKNLRTWELRNQGFALEAKDKKHLQMLDIAGISFNANIKLLTQ